MKHLGVVAAVVTMLGGAVAAPAAAQSWPVECKDRLTVQEPPQVDSVYVDEETGQVRIRPDAVREDVERIVAWYAMDPVWFALMPGERGRDVAPTLPARDRGSDPGEIVLDFGRLLADVDC